MSLADLPRHPLLDRPTPLERLARLGAELGHDGLWVKRDDAMPLGLGGNKLRSLEFWIGAALAEGADTLVVAGQSVSNQCRLTAAAAARTGLACVILHNSPEPERIAGNLLLSHLYGADIHYLGPVSEEARAAAARAKAAELRAAGRRPYIVGDPVLGAAGYVAGATELLADARAAGIDFRHILLPGSMGPTEAGLLYGLLAGGWQGSAHLVSVEYEAGELEARTARIFAALSDRIGRLDRGIEAILRIDTRWLAPGYGKAGPEALAAMRRLATAEALLLEETYTAKPFAALIAMVERGEIGPDEPACVLHTGGVPALFGAG